MSNRKQTYSSLKAWRLAQHWTIKQAAAHIGVSFTSYYWVERGGRPRPELMRRIMDRTGVSAAVLAQVA